MNLLSLATPSFRPPQGQPSASEHRQALSVLRLFLLVQVCSWGVAALAFLEHDSPLHATQAVWGLFTTTTVLLALSFVFANWQERFLSVALGAIVLLPAIGQVLALLQGERAFEKMSVELTFLLVVPVVLIAWLYSYRCVVTVTLLVLALGALTLLLSPLSRESRELMAHLLIDRAVVLLITGYVVSRLVRAMRDKHEQLALAHAKLSQHAAGLEQLTVCRERNRVARELHDTLAHSLSGLAVQLSATHAEWQNASRTGNVGCAAPRHVDVKRMAVIGSMLEQASSMARDGLGEVRRALRELRASAVEDLGLILALRALCEQFGERTGAQLELRLPSHPVELLPELEHGLYRIAQEAMLNVERHAGASHVLLELAVDGTNLLLTIDDDGCGFVEATVPAGKYGLLGLRERADLLGGSLTVTSVPQAGTSVRFALALEPRFDRVTTP